MTTVEILLTVLSALAAVFSAGALLAGLRAAKDDRAGKDAVLQSKISDLRKQVSDEFHLSRVESSRSLAQMAQKLETMTKSDYESRERLGEGLQSTLRRIQQTALEQSDRQAQLLDRRLQELQKSNEQKLSEMRATVDEKLTSTLTDRLNTSFKTVSEQLEKLYTSLGEMRELSGGMTDSITGLNRVLTNVKARGTWAEVQLKGILDQTIPGMYVENAATGEDAAQHVEFAVKLPKGGEKGEVAYLPIDSKFPMEDYIRLCAAADVADAQALAEARKTLETRVLDEAKEIRKYINVPRTTPYAILYLATEGLYAEIASSRSGLPERLQSEFNIMLAGPTTITALLNSLALGFKTVAINEKANEIRRLLGACKAQYELFGVLLEKASRKLEDAGKSLDEARHRNSLIQKKLRSVESLQPGEAEVLLGEEAAADGRHKA